LRENKLVAIKVIHPHLVRNEEAKNRFRQETEILAKLSHEHIVKLEQFHEDERGIFIILEYIDGIPLDKYLRGFKGDREELALKIIPQILDGLSNVHEKEIYHRDIKPSNIMLSSSNEVKIIDFGIAKMMDSDENLVQTVIEQGIGSPRFMSPEQVKCEKINHLTDIYSTGVVLHEILTGETPYSDITSDFELKTAIVHKELPDVSKYNQKVSSLIRSVLKRALEKIPELRFHSAEEFKGALLDDTIETPPIGEIEITIFSIPETRCAVIVGEQGSLGIQNTFSVKPYQSYIIHVSAEGFESKEFNKSFTLLDKNSSVEIELKPKEKEIPQKESSNTVVYVAAVLFIASGLWIAWLLSESNKTSKELIDTKEELEYYESL
jgi:serine/threonine protein kinase